MEESFKNFPYMQVSIFRQFLLCSHHTAASFVLQSFSKKIATVSPYKKLLRLVISQFRFSRFSGTTHDQKAQVSLCFGE